VFADGRHGWVVGDRGTILASEDGGGTWAAQSSGTTVDLNDVTFSIDSSHGWAVGAAGTILSTDDGGRTWKSRDSRSRGRLLAVAFAGDGRHGWALGGGTITATEDGGRTWAPQTLRGAHFLGLAAAGPARASAVGPSGAIVTTEDGGRNWTRVSSSRRLPAPWVWLAVLAELLLMIGMARVIVPDGDPGEPMILSYRRRLEQRTSGMGNVLGLVMGIIIYWLAFEAPGFRDGLTALVGITIGSASSFLCGQAAARAGGDE
jgi:hypothetical protein